MNDSESERKGKLIEGERALGKLNSCLRWEEINGSGVVYCTLRLRRHETEQVLKIWSARYFVIESTFFRCSPKRRNEAALTANQDSAGWCC